MDERLEFLLSGGVFDNPNGGSYTITDLARLSSDNLAKVYDHYAAKLKQEEESDSYSSRWGKESAKQTYTRVQKQIITDLINLKHFKSQQKAALQQQREMDLFLNTVRESLILDKTKAALGNLSLSDLQKLSSEDIRNNLIQLDNPSK